MGGELSSPPERRNCLSQIKQSFSWWCFDKAGMTPRQLLRAAAGIGYQGVELVEPERWPLIKEHGLTIVSTNGGLSIEQGLNRREHHEHFSHYHTAGNPGRHELDDTQELNYPPIVRAILETGYQGYLGQEFIPQGNPIAGLKQAFDVCDVRV